MAKEKIKWPVVSIIVCTFNCKNHVINCFEALKKQDYPKDKLELIAVDGYSTDGTIDILKQHKVKIFFSKDRPERGAKNLGYKKSKGEILIFLDSDNPPIEKDWIKKMVKPLIIDESVYFCISRIAVVKTDPLFNQYLSLAGPDPFVQYRFIDAQLSLGNLKLVDNGDYYTHDITLNNFVTIAGNYFTVRKKTLDAIGGYTQDTDVGYNLSKRGWGKVGIPKDAHIHHHNASGYISFVKKKIRWGRIFFNEQRFNRSFDWIAPDIYSKLNISARILNSLLFFPNLFVGLGRAIKFKQRAWILNPIMVYLTTVAYLYSYFYCKISKIKAK